jgi:hypothetical protein
MSSLHNVINMCPLGFILFVVIPGLTRNPVFDLLDSCFRRDDTTCEIYYGVMYAYCLLPSALCFLFFCGQCDLHFCCHPHLAFHLQLATMGLNDPMGNRKSQPHSLLFGRIIIIKDLLHLIG